MKTLFFLGVLIASFELSRCFSKGRNLHHIRRPLLTRKETFRAATTIELEQNAAKSILSKFNIQRLASTTLSLIASVVNPTIMGGLLSGGLHAITGTLKCFDSFGTIDSFFLYIYE